MYKWRMWLVYCRLSKEEQQRGESLSIENQQKILLRFCADHGFQNPKVFSDDGETGVFFDRPGLNAMLSDIRAGKVSTVIIKDQSRIGREVIEIGLLKRTFDEYNVRFMSAEDGLDTAKGFDIMSLLRDVFNEWYVADCSKKIRAVQRMKGLAGEPLSYPPYGYKKDPDDPKHWLVDEPAAEVVRQIFQYCMEGFGPTHIAKKLCEAKIEKPTVYAARSGYRKSERILDSYDWDTTTVVKILERREYLGHIINFKTYRKSYKNRKKLQNDPSNYAVFENVNDPIIEENVFERVQQIRKVKRRRDSSGRISLFSGLAFCADCGAKMYFSSGAQRTPEQDNYTCSGFRTKKKTCSSSHFVRRVVLEEAVLQEIQKLTEFANSQEQVLQGLLEQESVDKSRKELAADKKCLVRAQNRIRELDKIVQHLYEDHVLGNLTDERFKKLVETYEQEQKDQAVQEVTLRERITAQEEEAHNVDRFIAQIRKYTHVTELSTVLLNELVERIEIHMRDKSCSRRTQQVDIHFNYVGYIGKLDLTADPPPNPSKTKMAEK